MVSIHKMLLQAQGTVESFFLECQVAGFKRIRPVMFAIICNATGVVYERCSPMVLMISRSSTSYRGVSSCDPSSSDVVSPDIVYELLPRRRLQRKFLIYFPRGLSTRGKKGSPGSTIHSRGILRSRTDQTNSYLLSLTLPTTPAVVSSLFTASRCNCPSTSAVRGEKAFWMPARCDRCSARAARQEYRFFLKVSRRTFATTLERTHTGIFIARGPVNDPLLCGGSLEAAKMCAPISQVSFGASVPPRRTDRERERPAGAPFSSFPPR